jgi:hypothetical protein
MFNPDPDPTIAPSRIRIPDPGGKKAQDPTYFCIKAINKFDTKIGRIRNKSNPDPDPGYGG